MDLKHQFLIAMPAMVDPNFSGAVVYICDHSERGALGLVINRPTELTLEALFDRIDLKLEIAPWKDAPVFFGGPVQTERGFVLHGPPTAYSSTLPVAPEVSLTTSKDVLEAVAGGSGPHKMLVTLGYSGWGAGQRLLRLVGYGRALEYLATGAVLSPAQALAVGLVNHLSPPEAIQADALALAEQIASLDPQAVAAVKALLQAGTQLPSASAASFEQSLFAPLWAAEAHHQAVEKFLRRKQEGKHS